MWRLVLSHGIFVSYCSYVFYHYYTHLLSSTSCDTTILATESLSFWIEDRILFLKIWIFKSRGKSKVPQAWKFSAVVFLTFGLACSRLQDGGENGSNKKRCENRVRTGERGLLGRFFAVCVLFPLLVRFFRSSTLTETLAQVTFALTIFISVRKINASFEFNSL